MVRFGAALPPVKHAVDTMGIHVHALKAKDNYPSFLTENDMDAMQKAGFKVARTDLLWGAVEQKKGQYDFSAYDRFVDQCVKRGIKPNFILGLGNPLYGEHLSAYPASTRRAFEQYAKAAVAHFKGKGIIWELVQQPNQAFFWHPGPNAKDYAQLVNDLMPQLNQLDPTGHFVAPSLAGHDLNYQKALYPHGLLQHVDAVSVHPYRSKGKTPESIVDNVEKTKALLKQHAPGKHIPILLGEWGYHRLDVDADTQANYAVRQKLMGMMLGSPVNVWHDWKGDIMKVDDNPTDSEQQYSLVTKDLKPFPAYHALKNMQHALQGQQFKTRFKTDNPNDFILAFEGQGKQTLAAWTTGKPHTVTLPQGDAITLTGKPVFKSVTQPENAG
jgi:polysaccharide biosynthesis protein PslG